MIIGMGKEMNLVVDVTAVVAVIFIGAVKVLISFFSNKRINVTETS